tara:strand:+ start:8 stop:505 length:498 start_codon:yes stop_codon:yes gene_type:complete
MQEFKDSQGNVWGDFRALNKKTNISAKTAAVWVADGIFEAGVHYAQSDDEGKKVFYRLDLCADLHQQRLALHKNNLKAGKYLKVSPNKDANQKKQQLNLSLAPYEIEQLKKLQQSGEFVRYNEVRCGDIVLRSEGQPLSLTAIATELLRKNLADKIVDLYAQRND